VMYVWFDALTNYISTLGWPDDAEGKFKKFWEEGEVMQVAGKDQVRFQSIMWQAMLMSAGVKNSDQVLYHGFITSGGQKMSKSLGNVVSPHELVAKYGTDATRYLLLRHVHPFEDSDITWEKLDEWYNANLANGLGNFTARVMKLAQDNLSAPVEITEELKELSWNFTAHLDAHDYNAACNYIWDNITKADAYIQEKKPFSMVKSEQESEREEGKNIITRLVKHLFVTTVQLEPLLPATTATIRKAIEINTMPPALFPRKE